MTVDGRWQLVAIPQRDHHPLTRSLVRTLLAGGDVDQIIIFDNETNTPNGRRWLESIADTPKVEVRYRHGNGIIYQLWNEVWRDAPATHRGGQGVDLAIMNNDIDVPQSILRHLSRGLRAGTTPDGVWITYPDWTRSMSEGVDCTDPPQIRPTFGTWKKSGMSGFCFMLKPEKHDTDGWPFIDEEFRWLAGDGDLCSTMQERGATAARVLGVPCDYETRKTSHNGRNKGWVTNFSHQDMRKQRRKWKSGTRKEWEKWWLSDP